MSARLYYLILPGILMAMTGVGVGDLATAGFTGAQLGTTVLWAVVVGAAFKFVLTEGLARWQLATGQSLLQGAIEHLRWPFLLFMLFYFFPWCWFVGAALINATGVAGRELLMLVGLDLAKPWLAIFHSSLALALIWFGRQRYFAVVMSSLAGVLFVTVLLCAAAVPMYWSQVAKGLWPSPPAQVSDWSWIVALMGGVGGTLTVICYGYWMADSGRSGAIGLRQSRLDLLVSYALTALFGLAMVIIGAATQQEDKGLGLLLAVHEFFSREVSTTLAVLFLLGAWAAIFSSMLGVWQAVPQIFADVFYQLRGTPKPLQALPATRAYRGWLLVLALVPLAALEMSFKDAQKLYSLVGAFFMPVLAASLLYLNRRSLVPEAFANGRLATLALLIVFGFFTMMAVISVQRFIS